MRVDVRVERSALQQRPWVWFHPNLEHIDFDPPRTGPEVELRFRYGPAMASSAQDVVESYLATLGIEVLAIRSERFA